MSIVFSGIFEKMHRFFFDKAPLIGIAFGREGNRLGKNALFAGALGGVFGCLIFTGTSEPMASITLANTDFTLVSSCLRRTAVVSEF